MKKWILLAAAIGSEIIATLSLKGALDHSLLYTVVAVGYTAAFVFITGVLNEGMPLGVAYGIWGASGVAGTAVLSAFIFDEAITSLMVFGMGLVIAGVLVVEFGSQAAAKNEVPS